MMTMRPLVFLVAALVCSCHAGPLRATAGEAAGLAGAQARQARNEPRAAVAVMRPIGGSGVRGIVHFQAMGDGQVRVVGTLEGLSQGLHGFHVHEYGDVSDVEKGESAGDHFDPEGHPHGRPDDQKRHVGDLGNVRADGRGVAEFSIVDDRIALVGPQGILGRALVVHEEEDTFGQPSGDAGGRLAFGVIGVAPASSLPTAEDGRERGRQPGSRGRGGARDGGGGGEDGDG